MTTIAVVKKNGFASIAADTLTTYGNTKESAKYVVNSEKIIVFNENFLAFSGSASFALSFQLILSEVKKKISFKSIEDIFRAGLLIHKELKENYFLRPEDDESFETSRGDVLIMNPHGIFGLSSYRYVQEFSRFYANGSGCDFALGAMFAVYENEDKGAEEIAKIGLGAGIEFDDGSDSPITCYTLKLKEK